MAAHHGKILFQIPDADSCSHARTLALALLALAHKLARTHTPYPKRDYDNDKLNKYIFYMHVCASQKVRASKVPSPPQGYCNRQDRGQGGRYAGRAAQRRCRAEIGQASLLRVSELIRLVPFDAHPTGQRSAAQVAYPHLRHEVGAPLAEVWVHLMRFAPDLISREFICVALRTQNTHGRSKDSSGARGGGGTRGQSQPSVPVKHQRSAWAKLTALVDLLHLIGIAQLRAIRALREAPPHALQQ